MTMRDTELDILRDLEELGDDISQYTYLIQCAMECRPYSKEYRVDEYLVRDCQVNTWLRVAWDGGICVFDADSESLIVRGALALLQELYDGRRAEKIRTYRCSLPDAPAFAKHFTRDQLIGLRSMLRRVETEAEQQR